MLCRLPISIVHTTLIQLQSIYYIDTILTITFIFCSNKNTTYLLKSRYDIMRCNIDMIVDFTLMIKIKNGCTAILD